MYNVSFANTSKTKGYEGVVTWTSFESEEKFDEWYTEEIQKTHRIVEKGISDERCIELVRTTPKACRIAASLEEAIGQDGEVNIDILAMQLANLKFLE